MLLRSFVSLLHKLTPTALAESWDNVGFQVGDPGQEIIKALVVVDVTSETLKEALERKVDMILAHHPVIFDPLKAVIYKQQGDLIYQLIKNNLAVYVAHTNLDVVIGGVADVLAESLGLQELRAMVPSPANGEYFFIFYSSQKESEKVGAKLKQLQDQDHLQGWQTMELGKLVRYEGKINFLFIENLRKALKKFSLNPILMATEGKAREGLGRIGQLPKAINGKQLIDLIKKSLSIANLRFAGPLKKTIKTVALLPGSGGGYMHKAASMGADAFITADLKHHTALEAQERGILVIDPEHYPSESLAIPGWAKMIRLATQDVEILESQISTNPFQYG